MTLQKLSEKLDNAEEYGLVQKVAPQDIRTGLSAKIELRPYQHKAICRTIFQLASTTKLSHRHFLLQMATGSGKTVIMAALIIHLYQLGFRNFVFFVNSSQILEKTRDNFLNKLSKKYLFNDSITVDGRVVRVREVCNFSEATADDINIHFSTVQGLHVRLLEPKENSLTIDDFSDNRVALISDEAHHLNADTKKTPSKAVGEDKSLSWERSVQTILRMNPGNLLLDFTATADMEDVGVAEKYRDKLIIDYPLKQFRHDGYSKDVELRQVDLPIGERMLHAIILSQYRRKLAQAHGVNLKPVVLMKSRTVAESFANEDIFNDLIASLDGGKLSAVYSTYRDDDTLGPAMEYIFEERKIGFNDFAGEIQIDFARERLLNANSTQDVIKQQLLLNSLENYDNEIRVIFAVDKLNEGWDVLNLYDIVRLYDKRDGSARKFGKTTMSEAQLIGRGARYYPFVVKGVAGEKFKRKFDTDLDNRLRILEQLHYHCAHNVKYIDDIKRVLRYTGMMDASDRRVTLRLKKSFIESQFYQNQSLYLNSLRTNPRDDVVGLTSYMPSLHFVVPSLTSGRVDQVSAFDDHKMSGHQVEVVVRTLKLSSFGKSVVRSALDLDQFYRFNSLATHFPKLSGIHEFIDSDLFLGGVSVDVQASEEVLDSLSGSDRRAIVSNVLRQIKAGIAKRSVDRVGTKQFTAHPLRSVIRDKTIKVRDFGEQSVGLDGTFVAEMASLNIQGQDWHVYDDSFGTDQEKLLLRFVYSKIDELRKIYDDVYVIRNERFFTLFSFDEGRAFEPDYVIFLRKQRHGVDELMQVFVEPKGDQLKEKDSWKEDFLLQIGSDERVEVLFEDTSCRVIGLPFFNGHGEGRDRFAGSFQEKLGLSCVTTDT